MCVDNFYCKTIIINGILENLIIHFKSLQRFITIAILLTGNRKLSILFSRSYFDSFNQSSINFFQIIPIAILNFGKNL